MTSGRVNPNFRLDDQGISGLGNVYYNYLEPALIQEALKRDEGTLGQGGAFLVTTGKFTVLRKVKAGERPATPTAPAPTGFRALMEECWHQLPKKRPLIDTAREAVQRIAESAIAAATAAEVGHDTTINQPNTTIKTSKSTTSLLRL